MIWDSLWNICGLERCDWSESDVFSISSVKTCYNYYNYECYRVLCTLFKHQCWHWWGVTISQPPNGAVSRSPKSWTPKNHGWWHGGTEGFPKTLSKYKYPFQNKCVKFKQHLQAELSCSTGPWLWAPQAMKPHGLAAEKSVLIVLLL